MDIENLAIFLLIIVFILIIGGIILALIKGII